MEYRTFVSMNIAIVGQSEVSFDLALKFVDAGHVVYLADKDGVAANSSLRNVGNINLCSIEDAAEYADFIIIATAAQDVREVAYWLGDVRRKVIIDMTPNAAENNTGYINTARAISAITGAQHIVKVLSIKDNESHFKPLFGGDKIELILAGDSRKAKEITKIIAVECGYASFCDFGGSEAYALVDDLAKYWNRVKNIPQKTNKLITKHATRKEE